MVLPPAMLLETATAVRASSCCFSAHATLTEQDMVGDLTSDSIIGVDIVVAALSTSDSIILSGIIDI